MAKSNVYTRTGDGGKTSLVGGSRIEKDNIRLDAYGTVDEFSAHLGCVASLQDCPPQKQSELYKIQNMMFNIGCYLATPSDFNDDPDFVAGLTEDHIILLESWIDEMDSEIPPLKAFVLPGGSYQAAVTHVARTVCRRAERRIISLAKIEKVSPLIISYMNRLSDYLFVLSRWFNVKAGVGEITWKKE